MPQPPSPNTRRGIRVARAVVGVATIALCVFVWILMALGSSITQFLAYLLTFGLIGLTVIMTVLWWMDRRKQSGDAAASQKLLRALPREPIPLGQRAGAIAYLLLCAIGLYLWYSGRLQSGLYLVALVAVTVFGAVLASDLAATIYGIRGDHASALRAARLLARLTPYGQLQLGHTLLQHGRVEEAERALYRAPRNRATTAPLLLRLLAELRFTQGRWSEGTELARAGVQAHPFDPLIYRPLLFALLRAGEHEEARSLLEKRKREIRWSPMASLVARPVEPVVMALEAWALHQAGETGAAEETMKRALGEVTEKNRSVAARVHAIRALYSPATAAADRSRAHALDAEIVHLPVWRAGETA